MRIIRVLYVFIFMVMVSAAAFSQADSYESVRAAYDSTVKAGKASRNVYLNLGDRFYKIYLAAPEAPNADTALLYAGKSYKLSYEYYDNKSDMDIAHNYLRRASSSYETDAAAEAYLESAELFVQKRDLASAEFVLKRVQIKYPGSYHELAAASMLDDLSKMAKNSNTTVVDNSYVVPPVVINNPSNPPINIAPTIVPIDEDFDDNGYETVSVLTPTPQPVDASIPPGTVAIKDIRYHSNQDYSRIVIDLSNEQAVYAMNWLRENPEINMPPRLYVDIAGSVVSDNVPKETDIKDGLVNKVRWAYNAPGVTRVVLDSEGIESYVVFPLSEPSRIVIDVSNDPDKYRNVAAIRTTSDTLITQTIPIPTGTAVATGPRPTVPPVAPTGSKLGDNESITRMLGLKINTIVIDPGHGGKDPGTNIPGLKEKDIVLDIGKELKRLLEANTNIKVYMTRETDKFISLEERTAFANKNKADLFVSIHVNSAPNPAASGVESWVLNVTNDRDALELAAKENQTTTKSISDLQGIIQDIINNSKLKESLILAGDVQKGMTNKLKISGKRNRGIKQSVFYVLMGAQQPAVLVEVGFLSNKDEAAKLKTQEYRKEIARGLYDGLMNYVKNYN